MVSFLFEGKPLFELVLIYHQLDHVDAWKHITMKVFIVISKIHSKKYFSKWHLLNISHFVEDSMYYILTTLNGQTASGMSLKIPLH